MTRSFRLALVVCLALGGCGTLRKHHAPVCDGKHRRPANTQGSMLEPVASGQPLEFSAAPVLSYASCNG